MAPPVNTQAIEMFSFPQSKGKEGLGHATNPPSTFPNHLWPLGPWGVHTFRLVPILGFEPTDGLQGVDEAERVCLGGNIRLLPGRGGVGLGLGGCELEQARG